MVYLEYFKHRDPFRASEANVIEYLNSLVNEGKSYSVVNTHKSMLLHTLNLFSNSWCSNPILIARFMKGLYNKLLPKPRYSTFIWDVSAVLKYTEQKKKRNNRSLRIFEFKGKTLIISGLLLYNSHSCDIRVYHAKN